MAVSGRHAAIGLFEEQSTFQQNGTWFVNCESSKSSGFQQFRALLENSDRRLHSATTNELVSYENSYYKCSTYY